MRQSGTARPAARIIVGLVLLACTAPVAAWAQGGPQQLFPNAPPVVRRAPVVPAVPNPPPAPPAPIRGQELAPLGPASLSALAEGDPLAQAPWRALPPAEVGRLLSALPPPDPVTTATRLQRRLLLATAPQGADDLAALRQRVDGLLAIGDVAAANLLLKLSGATPGLDDLRARAALASGDAALACEQAQAAEPARGTGVAAAMAQASPLLARIACMWLQDGRERVDIALRIAEERGDAHAALYRPFVTILEQGSVQAMMTLDQKLRDLALATLGSGDAVELPPAQLDALPLPLLARLAQAKSASPAQRLAAARIAVAAGALDPAAWRAALAADRTLAPRLAAIDAASTPLARADRLKEAWAGGPAGTDRLLWAQALSPDVLGLEPSLETVSAATAAVPVAMLAGDKARVQRWGKLLALLAPERPDVEAMRQAVAPFLALAGGPKADGGALPLAASALLTALDLAQPPLDWLAVESGGGTTPEGAAPSAPAQLGLDAAVLDGGRGSVAAAALILLGRQPESLALSAWVDVLAALNKAGFTDDAARLAAARLILQQNPAAPESRAPAPT